MRRKWVLSRYEVGIFWSFTALLVPLALVLIAMTHGVIELVE